MSAVTQAQLLTAVRYILMLAGAWVAARGYIADDQINDLVSAVMIIGPVIWGFVTNHLKERETKAREAVAVHAGAAAAMDGISIPASPKAAQTIIKTYAPPKA